MHPTRILRKTLLRQPHLTTLPAAVRTANGDAKGRDGMAADAEQVPQLSALGDRVMDEPDCFNAITRTIFMCMQWRDTVALPKALRLTRPILLKLLASNRLESKDAEGLLSCCLIGLHVHGCHDESIGPLLSVGAFCYEKLRPKFENIRPKMLEIPECTDAAVQSYDEKLVFPKDPTRPVPDKFRKDQFRKLVKGIIGRHVSQQFKKKVQMRQLPPLMMLKSSRKREPVEDHADSLFALFGSDN